MKKKFVKLLATLFTCATLAFGFVACEDEQSGSSSNAGDSASTEQSTPEPGYLAVGMYWAEGYENPANVRWRNGASTGSIFNNDKLELGYVVAKHIKIVNGGTLALKWKLYMVANGDVSDLADVIDVYFIPTAQQITRESLASLTPVGTLRDLIEDRDSMAHGALLPENGTKTSEYEAIGEVTVTIALKMRESAGNEYQEMSLGDFGIQLLATQLAFGEDSFGPDYNEDAK